MPEEVLLRQEDMPEDDPRAENGGEGAEEDVREPKLYFIAKGKYDVYVKKNHGVSVNKYTSDKSKYMEKSRGEMITVGTWLVPSPCNSQ